MVKFIVWNVVLTAILIGFIWVGTTFFLDPMIKQWIEENGSEAFEGQVTLQRVSFQIFPLKIDLYGLVINKVNGTGDKIKTTVDVVTATLDMQKALEKNYDFDIKVTKPFIQYTQSPKPKTPPPPKPSLPFEAIYMGLEEANAKSPLSLTLQIENGGFGYFGIEDTYELSDLEFNLHIPALQADWTAESTGNLSFKNYNLNFPLSLNTTLFLERSNLKVKKADLTFAGIQAQAQGNFNIDSKAQGWSIITKIPQIENLKVPLDLACVKLASGSLDLEAKVMVAEQANNISATGHAVAQRISGISKCQIKDTSLNGKFSVNSDINFIYADKTFNFDKFILQSDLTELEIKYKNLFSKPIKKTLTVDVNGAVTNKIFALKTGRVQLDHMIINSQGTLNFIPGAPSDISASLSKSSLVGTEEIFPLLKGFPVQGYLEFSSQIKGDLSNPESLSIEVNPLIAQGVRTNVTWKNEEETSTINGPLSLNLRGIIKSRGSQLQQADISTQIDLTNINLKSPGFVKPNLVPLKFDLLAQQTQNKITIKRGNLKLPGGEVFIAGDVANIAAPILNLQFKTSNLQLTDLLKLSPFTTKYKINGATSSQLKVLGRYDFKNGIEKSPLTLSGTSTVVLNTITIPEKTKEERQEKEHESVTKPQPLTPTWPLFKNLNLNLNLKIASVKYDNLPISGIQNQMNISNGILNAKGSIDSFFGGKINLNNLSLSLVEAQPTTDISAKIQNFQLGTAMNWLFPQWKDLISGNADGDFNFKIAHHSKSDFVKQTAGNGNFKIKNGFLSTVSVDQMVNDKLSKIPILAQQNNIKVNSKGMKGDIDGVFKYTDGKILFSNFHILTPERNELTGTGWVSTDKTLDFNSKVYLINAPVKGSVFEANSDAQKRFILPVHIRGGILSPEVDITQDTINVLLQNTAKHEGQKKVNELKNEVQKKAVDQLKKIFQ